MQLFITDQFEIKNNQIVLSDERVYYQCTKVLRYKPWDEITLQSKNIRYLVELESWDKKSIFGKLISQSSKPIGIDWERPWNQAKQWCQLIVSMVNKRDKMELIAQKAAEIGIDSLWIWVSKRSVITVISENKLERIQSIMLEAAEQSRNRSLPQLQIIKHIKDLSPSYVAYQYGNEVPVENAHKESLRSLIVGPEWGFEPTEIDHFRSNGFVFTQFGESVLRTETAAIIWAWWLKNS